MRPLVTTDEVARHPEWRLYDCRFDLAQPALGERQYAVAHLPGALYAHLDRDLSGPRNGRNGRHPLPHAQDFARWLGRCGVRPSDVVVCYDAQGGTVAARLWWLLRWIGHERAAVLDGGYPKWVAEGRPVTAQVPGYEETVYPARPQPEMTIDVDALDAALGRVLLVDARSAVRWRGEAEPIDPVAGRIPGARNRFCGENLDEHGLFKSAERLRAEYGALLGEHAPTEVVHYCGSGVSACHNALAMELAGIPGSRVYTGSWSEWIAEARRPRERG